MVSMSLVLEAAFAHYLGLRVLGVTLVSNRAGDSAGTHHHEVLQTASTALPVVRELLRTALTEISW